MNLFMIATAVSIIALSVLMILIYKELQEIWLELEKAMEIIAENRKKIDNHMELMKDVLSHDEEVINTNKRALDKAKEICDVLETSIKRHRGEENDRSGNY